MKIPRDKALTAVAADLHLDGSMQSEWEFHRFLKWLQNLGVTDLIILGDMFDYLIGDRKLLSDRHARALGLVKEFRSRGGRVNLVEGNREFFVSGSFLQGAYFDSISMELDLTIGEKRFIFEHGDRIDPYDTKYRFWRFVSKNKVSYLVMKFVPGFAAKRIVDWFERNLKDLSPESGPLDRLVFWSHAGHRFMQGYDFVVTGHFHRLLLECDGPKKLVALPAWKDSRACALITSKGELAVTSA